MKARIRRIGVRSVFVLFLVLYGMVGLVVGGAVAALGNMGMTPDSAATAVDALGWWAVPALALAYGLVGGLAGAVAAALYNLAALVTGGVRMQLEESTRVRIEEEGGD